VEPFRSRLENEGLPDASGVSSMKAGAKLSYAGYVICRQMPENAKGAMFITLEDESGFVNVVVWSRVYSQHRTTILTNWFLGVTGHLQKGDGVTHIVAESFWKPDFLSSGEEHSARSRDFH
jgi:error-prone DNA polymerase